MSTARPEILNAAYEQARLAHWHETGQRGDEGWAYWLGFIDSLRGYPYGRCWYEWGRHLLRSERLRLCYWFGWVGAREACREAGRGRRWPEEVAEPWDGVSE